jgi:predicted dithiol-disulfide oxidoreductase (DUF899 family)
MGTNHGTVHAVQSVHAVRSMHAVGSVHTTADEDYRQARTALLAAERELRAANARVAALRAALPRGPRVDHSIPLTTSTGKPTTLGGLLGEHTTLLAYHLVFDEGRGQPSDMCAMWVDGLDALVPHLRERTSVAVLAPASPGQLADLAARRGWHRIQVVSTQPGDLTDRLDLRTDPAAGGLRPSVSTFTLGSDGLLRLHWHGRTDLHDPATPSAPRLDAGDGLDGRGIDPLCATWSLLDLLPQGRGDWHPTRRP